MAPLVAQAAEPRDAARGREASSRPVNGSSSSTSRGAVQQRALERQPLPHAAREAGDGIVGAVGEPRARRARASTRAAGVVEAVEPGEERRGSRAAVSSG